MHTLNIVHWDIKPENIMIINGGKNIKFVDFGTAKDLEKKIYSKGNSSTGRKYYEHFVGTPNYMPPE